MELFMVRWNHKNCVKHNHGLALPCKSKSPGIVLSSRTKISGISCLQIQHKKCHKKKMVSSNLVVYRQSSFSCIYLGNYNSYAAMIWQDFKCSQSVLPEMKLGHLFWHLSSKIPSKLSHQLQKNAWSSFMKFKIIRPA